MIAFEFCKWDWNQVYSLNVQLEYDFKPYHLTGIVLRNQEVFQKFVLDGGSFHDVSIIYVQFLSNIAMFS